MYHLGMDINVMTNEVNSLIDRVEAGKVPTIRSAEYFSRVCKAVDQSGNIIPGYMVQFGFAVDEAHDDDYLSCTFQPLHFPRPWVGREIVVPCVTEAIELLPAGLP